MMRVYKQIFLGITLVSILFLLTPVTSAHAEELCSSIGPETVIKWDSSDLKVAQIGRLTILKNTPLYKLTGETKETSRVLKKGETYRIYAFKPGKLSVGGGLFVDRDDRINYETPSKVKLGQQTCKKQAIESSQASIQLDELKGSVEAKLGKEKRTSLNEYNLNWYTYYQQYHHFYMVSYLDNKVAGMFTMDDRYYVKNIHVGSTSTDVKNALGNPIKGIVKGNTNYLLNNSNGVQTFDQAGFYITIFYDLHNQGKVTGIQILSKSMENRKAARFGIPSSTLKQAFEMQMFDLINAARVTNGLLALGWDERERTAARKHSLDMAVNHFFDHVNLKGEDPFVRMKAEGIYYRTAGENIAMGYSSSIFAHEAFMNSLGHRENILNSDYTFVGVGEQFQANTNVPYFTQDFFTP
ncbi:CAP-associated domain-containing protein [Neobacillus sp. PS3-40]|uniref:CAP domain-containing protein n=1 Tax=Neobacillus sp. PS3-40 TaxID=3070679 RepID=UPI0027E051F6|nr:CAP-associated domain-containing protein [Neobacillus sp. PS3-40]WML46121.1 CAP-associated domain-containing protein [Neobacillus sp. PS3-40]